MKQIAIMLLTPFALVLTFSIGYASEEGLEWGRFRLRPRLSLSEVYSDNIYLTNADERCDYVTTLSPGLALDVAIVPRNYITMSYEGSFRHYGRTENFRKEAHHGELSWTWITPKESKFEAGTRMHYDSIQPFSEEDRPKDYIRREAFLKALIKAGALTEVALSYEYDSRRFREAEQSADDYDRNTVTVGLAYEALPKTMAFAEYRYAHHTNNSRTGLSGDEDANTLFVGARWAPTVRLAGTLKVGYSETRYDTADDFRGLVVDTNLTYTLSDITMVTLKAFRTPVKSTASARESGEYYVSTGAVLSAVYRRWEPLAFYVNLGHTRNDFKRRGTSEEKRRDDIYLFELKAGYRLDEWCAVTAGYRYRDNLSNVQEENYRENRMEVRIVFSL